MAEPRQVYRSRFARILFVPTVIGVLAASLVFWTFAIRSDASDLRRSLLFYTPVELAWCFLLYRMWRSRIEVRPDAITVRNAFGPTLEIPWRDIRVFDEGGGFWGIDLVLRTGGRIPMNAVQKSNLARWTNSRTRADRVVHELNDHLEGFTGRPV